MRARSTGTYNEERAKRSRVAAKASVYTAEACALTCEAANVTLAPDVLHSLLDPGAGAARAAQESKRTRRSRERVGTRRTGDDDE